MRCGNFFECVAQGRCFIESDQENEMEGSEFEGLRGRDLRVEREGALLSVSCRFSAKFGTLAPSWV